MRCDKMRCLLELLGWLLSANQGVCLSLWQNFCFSFPAIISFSNCRQGCKCLLGLMCCIDPEACPKRLQPCPYFELGLVSIPFYSALEVIHKDRSNPARPELSILSNLWTTCTSQIVSSSSILTFSWWLCSWWHWFGHTETQMCRERMGSRYYVLAINLNSHNGVYKQLILVSHNILLIQKSFWLMECQQFPYIFCWHLAMKKFMITTYLMCFHCISSQCSTIYLDMTWWPGMFRASSNRSDSDC